MPAYCLLLFSATNVYYHSFQFSVNQNFKIFCKRILKYSAKNNHRKFRKKQSSEIPQKTITGNPVKNNHRKSSAWKDRQEMANPQTLSVNPQGTGGPSVGQKILPLSVFSFPAGIAEHMVVFIPGMQVNLQQHDCTLFQCSFHPAFRDPWMKMNRNILFHADSAKTPAQVKCRHKIGSAAEPAKQVFVPVGMHAPADLCKLQEHILALCFQLPAVCCAALHGTDNVDHGCRTAVSCKAVFKLHKLSGRAIGSKGDPDFGSPSHMPGFLRGLFCRRQMLRYPPAAGLSFAAEAGFFKYLICLSDHLSATFQISVRSPLSSMADCKYR
jgi:hypothetical protein